MPGGGPRHPRLTFTLWSRGPGPYTGSRILLIPPKVLLYPSHGPHPLGLRLRTTGAWGGRLRPSFTRGGAGNLGTSRSRGNTGTGNRVGRRRRQIF